MLELLILLGIAAGLAALFSDEPSSSLLSGGDEGSASTDEGLDGAEGGGDYEHEDPAEYADDDTGEDADEGDDDTAPEGDDGAEAEGGEIDHATLSMAAAMGIPQATALRYGNREQLLSALTQMALQQQMMPQPQPQQQYGPQQQKQEEELFNLAANTGDPEKDYDPELVKMGDVVKRQHKAIADLQERLEGMQAGVIATQQEAIVREFDAAVNGLGEPFEQLLGTGSRDQLDPLGPEFRNREMLWTYAGALYQAALQANRTMGTPIPTLQQLVKKAAHANFEDKIHGATLKGINQKANSRAQKAGVKPGTRKPGRPTERDMYRRAERVAEQKLGELRKQTGEDVF